MDGSIYLLYPHRSLGRYMLTVKAASWLAFWNGLVAAGAEEAAAEVAVGRLGLRAIQAASKGSLRAGSGKPSPPHGPGADDTGAGAGATDIGIGGVGGFIAMP